MSDRAIRERVGKVPCPEFEDPAFNTPPTLDKATVAIVTTLGLRRPGESGWKPQDPSFRVIDRGATGLTVAHLSPNFDRTGVTADINVAYPIDRLTEMADEGVIGAVARRHLTFMGAQDETMTTIRMDTGPAAAKLLRDDGVDVAIFTPV